MKKKPVNKKRKIAVIRKGGTAEKLGITKISREANYITATLKNGDYVMIFFWKKNGSEFLRRHHLGELQL